MTGPDHYREAERLRAQAREAQNAAFDHHEAGTDPTRAWNNAMHLLAAAQVHADLAQAAATIDATGYTSADVRNGAEWTQVLS